jgi:hypothetical protein
MEHGVFFESMNDLHYCLTTGQIAKRWTTSTWLIYREPPTSELRYSFTAPPLLRQNRVLRRFTEPESVGGMDSPVSDAFTHMTAARRKARMPACRRAETPRPQM